MPRNSDYKNNPQAFEEINTRKGALLRRENYVWSTSPIPTTKLIGIAPSALSMWSGLVYFFFKQNLLAFRGEVLYNSTCR